MGFLQSVGNSLMTSTAKCRTSLKANSPEILVGIGLVGVVAGTVLACKATLHCDPILEEMDNNLQKIDRAQEIVSADGYEGQPYPLEDQQRDVVSVYVKGGVQLAKLYAPAIIVMAVSMTSILCGHRILRKRNLALTAAYGVLSEGFSKYRERVKASLGDDADRTFLHGLKEEVIGTEEYTDADTGKTKKVKVKGYTTPDGLSLYSRFFDESCEAWENNAYYNEVFLANKQKEANRTLRRRGCLTLNDVYSMLDIPSTEAGFVVGWIYDPHYDPVDHNMEDQVDFRIFNPRNSGAINGLEPVYLLDFNVQGTIYDKVPNARKI